MLFRSQKSKFSKRLENLRGAVLENIKNICAKFHLRGGLVGHKPWLRHHPLGGGGQACGAHTALPPQPQVYKFPFVLEKIKREDFVVFTIRRRRHNLFFIWRADLESVFGSVEGESSPLSSSTFFPLQFHEALHRS